MARGVCLGQEEHADAEQVRVGESSLTEALGLADKQASRNLGQDARAISALAIGRHGAAMAQVGYRLDCFGDNVVVGLTAQARDKANAARVVFEPRVIQPTGSGK